MKKLNYFKKKESYHISKFVFYKYNLNEILAMLLFLYLLSSDMILSAQNINSELYKSELKTWNLILLQPSNGFIRDKTGHELAIGRFLNDNKKFEITIIQNYFLNNESIDSLYNITSNNNSKNIDLKDTIFKIKNMEVFIKYLDNKNKNFIDGVFTIGYNYYYFTNSSDCDIENSIDTLISILNKINLYKKESIEQIRFLNSYKEILTKLIYSQLSVDDYLINKKLIQKTKNRSFYDLYENDKEGFLNLMNENNKNIKQEFTSLSKFGTPQKVILNIDRDRTVQDGYAFNGFLSIYYENNIVKVKTAILLLDNNFLIWNFKIIN